MNRALSCSRKFILTVIELFSQGDATAVNVQINMHSGGQVGIFVCLLLD